MQPKWSMIGSMGNINALLVGGNGFIGSNLREEFTRRHVQFDSMDIDDEDLTKSDLVMTGKLKNVTHVFLLASKVGSELFNRTPIEPYCDNISLLYSFIDAISKASTEYGRKYHVVWYSSSEIFGSADRDKTITDCSEVRLNMSSARTLYSIVKITGELLFKQMYNEGQIGALTILRLFNISGVHQKRGVVYKMMKSAVENGKIEFSDDTTRTITSVYGMLDQTFDAVLNNESGIVERNVSDGENSVYMEDLAGMMKDYLVSNNVVDKVELVRKEPDAFLRHRHTGVVKSGNVNETAMNRIFDQVLWEVRNVRQQL
jgi:nucleoside-diphosphate-sugar epimerase